MLICQEAFQKYRVERRDRAHRSDTSPYALQGVNSDVQKEVCGLDFKSVNKVSPYILQNIKETQRATKRHQSMLSFNAREKEVITCLDNAVILAMIGNHVFADCGGFDNDYELGYVCLMRMPVGTTVTRHIDPSKECDFAAIFVCKGSRVNVGDGNSYCTVCC